MNSKEQKALQLAMEAFDYMVVPRGFHVQNICQKAYEAIVEALEPVYSAPPQPEQRTGNCLLTGVCASEGHKIQKVLEDDDVSMWPEERDENTGSPPSDYYAEGWNDCLKSCWEAHRSGVRGYAPKQSWVGFTDEDIREVWYDDAMDGSYVQKVRQIEAKLKEKNNG